MSFPFDVSISIMCLMLVVLIHNLTLDSKSIGKYCY